MYPNNITRLPLTLLIVLTVIALGALTSSVYAPKSSTVAPQGYTGATGLYCTSCHSSYALNAPGGSVSLTGISATTFNPSQAINFSLAINHSAANRNRWGFAIKAVNNAGASVGTFNTTNPNAILNGTELSHRNAPSSATATNSYTFSGLIWTAPADVSGDNSTVKFYYAANAAFANFSSSSDYIYAGTLTLNAIPPPACDTAYWTGAFSTAWETAGNWSCGAAPSGNTVVYINATAVRFPVIRSAATCKKIFTALGTSLEITDGYSLNVTGQGP
jgi:hypothetical protein